MKKPMPLLEILLLSVLGARPWVWLRQHATVSCRL